MSSVMEQNGNIGQRCKTCGDCACYVNGKCYFNHDRGIIADVDEKAEACRYFMLRSTKDSLFNPNFSETAETMAKLKEKYGYDVRCGECFWFVPYKDNPKMGICGATRFDLKISCNGYACHRFELPVGGKKNVKQ